jgi:hypothetical protein
MTLYQNNLDLDIFVKIYIIIEINELFLVYLKCFLFKITNFAKFLVNCYSSKSYDLLILLDIKFIN